MVACQFETSATKFWFVNQMNVIDSKDITMFFSWKSAKCTETYGAYKLKLET
jgi:hypothetical protein